MLNYIWLGLILFAVVVGGLNGHLKEVGDGALRMTTTAVMDIALPMTGVMALWLGMMRLAEKSGLVTSLARFLKPVMRRLFPDVPPEHPAMGSMVMNMAANLLGLANSATPLGLRAMEDLESLNPTPGTATNAMCTFMAINTSSIQLIPVTALAILASHSPKDPTAIIGTSFAATCVAFVAAIITVKFLEKLPVFRLPAVVPVTVKKTAETTDGKLENQATAAAPIEPWGWLILAGFYLLFAYLLVNTAFPAVFGHPIVDEMKDDKWWIRLVKTISLLAVPFLLSLFPLYAALRRIKVYEEFVEGAKEGFQVAVRIIPYLVAMLVAVAMFRASGGIDMLTNALRPVLDLIHFPPELVPMSLIRPLSGSGSLGIFTEMVTKFGPDHILTRTAGTIYGSTETTFYVLAVYFGAVGIKRTRHAVAAGLVADAVGILASVFICKMMFGY